MQVDVRSRDGPRCLFCFPAAISPSQLLVSTPNFYLLAPVGQVVEGYLSIMTRACHDTPFRLRCFDDVLEEWFPEIETLQSLITGFYSDVYDAPPVFYEHGRGGGGASAFAEEDYAFHPHLCSLPGSLRIHEPLSELFASSPAPLPGLREQIGFRPYIYVHTPFDAGHQEPLAYFTADDPADGRVTGFRLKKLLVDANGLDSGWDWRTHPGESELNSLIERFTDWYTSKFRHY